MLISDYRELCPVSLPYAARQKRYHTFDLADPEMPEGFEDYLEPVLALTHSAGATEGMAHMTVDEKVVLAGNSQRRPGWHVDGCFVPANGGTWSHGGGSWSHKYQRMSVIVAASAVGCQVWRGLVFAEPASDGDLSHVMLPSKGEIVPANVGYLLSPDCVHQSLVQQQDTQRTFLRIALPLTYDGGWRKASVAA